jgi:hypothetical protein
LDTTLFQDLLLQNAAVRRATARSARGLRNPATASRRRIFEEFLADSQADLASLGALRKTAERLLSEGIEAEAFRQFCERALEAADIVLKATIEAENTDAGAFLSDPENVNVLLLQAKRNSEQARVVHSYFDRLARGLRTSPAPLPPDTVEKLNSLAPVTGKMGNEACADIPSRH